MLCVTYPQGPRRVAPHPAGVHAALGSEVPAPSLVPAAAPATGAWRRCAYDGALVAGSTIVQAGALLWTYKHHTPALAHAVAAVAATQVLFPVVRLAWQHLRAETPGLTPPPQSLCMQRVVCVATACSFALCAIWDGVFYGLWLGSLATQLGVATVWGAPALVGAGVLAATCAVAIGIYALLPPAPMLSIDTAALLRWAKLQVGAWASNVLYCIDSDPASDSQDAARAAQAAVSAQMSRMWRQSIRAVTHLGVWRNELIVGTALGVWQGARVASGHVGVIGALAGVSLLFPLAQAVFRPLSQGPLRPEAQAQNRWILTEDNQAHAVGRGAMRLGLAAALWAAKPI